MPLNKLRRSFEERKASLIEQIQRNKEDLDLSQQHQIYGAIKEIENFLKSIDYYRTLEAENAFDIDLSKEREWPFFKRTQRVVRSIGRGMKEVIVWVFVKVPVKCGRGIKGSYSEYRERREYTKRALREFEKQKQKK